MYNFLKHFSYFATFKVLLDNYTDDNETGTTEAPEECPPGTKWNECKISCNQLCESYKYDLRLTHQCRLLSKCLPGCTNETSTTGKYWRDEYTLVSKEDCTCATKNGTFVKVIK